MNTQGIQEVEPEIPRIYVPEIQVAKITGKALSTLRNDRSQGRGIPYSKDGKSVRYYLPDVYAHMRARRIQTAGEE